jgi:PIN domain nuclease of toxin-antitoxin system
LKLLLDTHTFLWGLEDSPRLSAAARDALGSAENDLLLSVASAWEMSIKAGLGQLDLSGDIHGFLTEQIRLWRIELLPVTLRHATAVRDLPQHHRDPFDRMLVVQAVAEEAVLVTDDERLSRYDVEVLW